MAAARDTVKGMIFNGMIDAVRAASGEEAAARCKAVAKQKRFIDFFFCPVADYLRMAWFAVELLEKPLGSVDADFFQLGRRAVLSFLDTGVDKTLLVLISNDLRRALGNADMAYRTTISYGERSLRWPGPREARFEFKGDFLVPPFHAGVIKTGLEAIGKKPVRVTATSLGFMQHAMDIAWDE